MRLSLATADINACLREYSGTRVDVSRKHVSQVAFSLKKKLPFTTERKDTLTLVPL